MKKILFVLSLVLPLNAGAITITPKGAVVGVEYQEPNTNKDNTPLKDLGKTTIYHQPVGSTVPVVNTIVPATASTGDGMINKDITISVPDGSELSVDIWATASDTTGNESDKSNVIRISIDKLAPAPPK